MAQEKYPLPSMKLGDIVKLVHSKVVKSKMSASDKAGLNTLLKSAAFKIHKKEHAKAVSVSETRKKKIIGQKFSDPEVSTMMKEAVLELDKKEIENQKLKSKITTLDKDSKELKNLQTKMHEDRVDEIVKTEHKLGIVSKEEVADKSEIYKKLHSEDLDKIEASLIDKKPLTKAQKMSEVSEEDGTDDLEAKRKLFASAGIELDPSEIEGDILIQD